MYRIQLSQAYKATTRRLLLFTTKSQEFPVFIWSTLDGWKAEPNLEYETIEWFLKLML